MRRVLKPGGVLLFCEHGESPDDRVQRYQRRVEPTWKKLFGGCHLTRPIPDLIEKAGFRMRELEANYLEAAKSTFVPDALKVSAFEYWGAAETG